PDYIIPDPTGHEDLVTCRSIVTQNFVTTESNNDENGHGTHVAGTIGACTNNATGIAGANWAVQLLSAKVLDFSGSGTYSALAAAGQLQHVFSVLLVRVQPRLRCDERDVHGRAARVRSGGLDLGAGQVHIKYLRAGGD